MTIDTAALYADLQAAHAARHELMKWKLVIVAVGGGAAIGFGGQTPLPRSYLILCVLPIACAYVDLLCRNLSIRTKLHVTFLAYAERTSPSPGFETFYEEYSKQWKRHSLESIALIWSSIVVSVLVTIVGIGITGFGPTAARSNLEMAVFIIAGSLGTLLAAVVDRIYEYRIRCINERASSWFTTP